MDGPHGLTDEERRILDALHARGLSASKNGAFRFSHREHLRLAWDVMRGRDLTEGLGMITRIIRRIAESHGDSLMYHETLTLFWGRIVYHALNARPDTSSFDEFLAQYPFLLEKGLPLRHWSTGTLWADSARNAWAAPDILPLPEF